MSKVDDDLAAALAEIETLKAHIAELEDQIDTITALNAALMARPQPTPQGAGEVLADGTERAEGAIPQPISVTSTTS